jgi:hypothetical protein
VGRKAHPVWLDGGEPNDALENERWVMWVVAATAVWQSPRFEVHAQCRWVDNGAAGGYRMRCGQTARVFSTLALARAAAEQMSRGLFRSARRRSFDAHGKTLNGCSSVVRLWP